MNSNAEMLFKYVQHDRADVLFKQFDPKTQIVTAQKMRPEEISPLALELIKKSARTGKWARAVNSGADLLDSNLGSNGLTAANLKLINAGNELGLTNKVDGSASSENSSSSENAGSAEGSAGSLK